MKNRILLFVFCLFISNFASAERAWIGERPIAKINFVQSNVNCGPTYGACLLLTFEDGATGCDFIAIRESDAHFKHIESMAYISLTSGKNFKVYASDEYCHNADMISINNTTLY